MTMVGETKSVCNVEVVVKANTEHAQEISRALGIASDIIRRNGWRVNDRTYLSIYFTDKFLEAPIANFMNPFREIGRFDVFSGMCLTIHEMKHLSKARMIAEQISEAYGGLKVTVEIG